jgi:hypothetical protein
MVTLKRPWYISTSDGYLLSMKKTKQVKAPVVVVEAQRGMTLMGTGAMIRQYGASPALMGGSLRICVWTVRD